MFFDCVKFFNHNHQHILFELNIGELELILDLVILVEDKSYSRDLTQGEK